MKTKITLIATLFVLFTGSAQAAVVQAASSSSYEGGGSGPNRFGLGLASVGTPIAGGNATMITAWIPIKTTMGIQPYLGILSTTGSFNFLAGGAFKATVAGTGNTGLHVGGDFLLGSISSTFVANFGGLFGLHWMPHSSIMIAVDGGPQIGIASGVANFSLQSVSGLLGLNLIYFL